MRKGGREEVGDTLDSRSHAIAKHDKTEIRALRLESALVCYCVYLPALQLDAPLLLLIPASASESELGEFDLTSLLLRAGGKGGADL